MNTVQSLIAYMHTDYLHTAAGLDSIRIDTFRLQIGFQIQKLQPCDFELCSCHLVSSKLNVPVPIAKTQHPSRSS